VTFSGQNTYTGKTEIQNGATLVAGATNTSCRRATAEMLAPGSKLSAKIRARSSSLHRRRRVVPVISSIRR
jgi:autotransporter-associated beta strand protein